MYPDTAVTHVMPKKIAPARILCKEGLITSPGVGVGTDRVDQAAKSREVGQDGKSPFQICKSHAFKRLRGSRAAIQWYSSVSAKIVRIVGHFADSPCLISMHR